MINFVEIEENDQYVEVMVKPTRIPVILDMPMSRKLMLVHAQIVISVLVNLLLYVVKIRELTSTHVTLTVMELWLNLWDNVLVKKVTNPKKYK